jgi:hypothetical protein
VRGSRWPRIRFSLRTFLIVCVLPVPFLTWIANLKLSAVRQRQALAHFQNRGFNVGLDDVGQSSPRLMKALCDFVDPQILMRVTYLEATQPLNQDDLQHIPRLHGLSNLHFYRQGVPPKPAEYAITDADIRRIASIQSLSGITLDAPLKGDSIREFASLPQLDSLMLPQAKVDSRFLAAIVENPRMAALEFNGSFLDRAALGKLAKLPLLQTLVIHDLAPDSLSALANCRALTGLVLVDCKLTDADAESMKSLRFRTLDLVNPTVEKGFFRKLEHHPTIVRITVQVGVVYFSTSAAAEGDRPIALGELEHCEGLFTTEETFSNPSSTSVSP